MGIMQKNKFVKLTEEIVGGRDISDILNIDKAYLSTLLIHKVESIRVFVIYLGLLEPEDITEESIWKCIRKLSKHIGYSNLASEMTICIKLRNILSHDIYSTRELINESSETIEECIGFMDEVLNKIRIKISELENKESKNMSGPNTSNLF